MIKSKSAAGASKFTIYVALVKMTSTSQNFGLTLDQVDSPTLKRNSWPWLYGCDRTRIVDLFENKSTIEMILTYGTVLAARGRLDSGMSIGYNAEDELTNQCGYPQRRLEERRLSST
jgi:hypothetical protein